MNDKKAALIMLSNELLLEAYAGALLMTIPEARTSEDVISIDQAWADANDLAAEILNRMRGSEGGD